MAWDWDMGQWFTPSKSDHQSGEQYNAQYNATGGGLEGIRKRLEALATERTAWGETAKAESKDTFAKGLKDSLARLSESMRAEKGFGNTSMEPEWAAKIQGAYDSGERANALSIDKYVTDANEKTLRNSYDMYSTPEQQEQPSWQSGLMGTLGQMGGEWLGSGNNAQNLWSWVGNLFKGGNTGGINSNENTAYLNSLTAKSNPGSSIKYI